MMTAVATLAASTTADRQLAAAHAEEAAHCGGIGAGELPVIAPSVANEPKRKNQKQLMTIIPP